MDCCSPRRATAAAHRVFDEIPIKDGITWETIESNRGFHSEAALQDNKDSRLRDNSFVYDVLTKSEIIWLLNSNPCEQAAPSSSPTNGRFQIRLLLFLYLH
ncbi:uncharacterized protein [Triticum aestivum]|uniref:uncharacterized protein n=1 Tax=Triticum aestivum TaxID=4565 RepID=UPI001D00634B|nr:uncharacterized protein LOC123085502 [Triticum aestivum]